MGFRHEKLDGYREAMLTKLGPRGYAVHEDRAEYSTEIDSDTDSDPDADRVPPKPLAKADGNTRKTDRQPGKVPA